MKRIIVPVIVALTSIHATAVVNCEEVIPKISRGIYYDRDPQLKAEAAADDNRFFEKGGRKWAQNPEVAKYELLFEMGALQEYTTGPGGIVSVYKRKVEAQLFEIDGNGGKQVVGSVTETETNHSVDSYSARYPNVWDMTAKVLKKAVATFCKK